MTGRRGRPRRWDGTGDGTGDAVGDAMAVEVRVLGPLEVVAGGRQVELGGPRLRAVLALLAARAGRVVSVAVLVDALWPQDAPPGATRNARTYVSRLRAVLPDGLVTTRAPGYVLRAGSVDAGRFEQLAATGREEHRSGRSAEAARSLAAALQLWRGDAYGEFGATGVLAAEAVRLERLRLTAVEDRIAAELACGAGAELVAELEALVERHPAHERLWEQLMTALFRSGRQADALATYRRARAALVEAAGVEPSPALVALHGRLLAQDGSLLPRAAAVIRPAQLPPAVTGFSGRERDLATLDSLVGGICVLSGTAGVGKTTLALHWAHRAVDRFPDGSLYADLAGFDPVRPPRAPGDAVRGMLEALGVAGDRMPADLDGRVALYRSLLAGRRMLVVLDNARDAAQVQPLLPGEPGCLALVTSRDRLVALVARQGARPVPVDLPDDADARALLGTRLRGARPDTVAEIVARCARLPLALAVVAGRAATRPGSADLAEDLAAELRAAAGDLDVFDGGDPVADVRSVLSWSYRAVSAEAARLFRLLGLHPGPEVGVAVAASLAGVPVPAARRALAELSRATLLEERSAGRYGRHDLLAAYAAELGRADPAAGDAVRRMLEHYLRTAEHAAGLLYGSHPTDPGVAEPATDAAALAWFAAEREALLGAIRLSAEAGLHALTGRLAWSVLQYLDTQGWWVESVRTQETALAAAERLGDRRAVASAHRRIATAYIRLRRLDEAEPHLAAAVRGHEGDPVQLGHDQLALAGLRDLRGRPDQALEHGLRARAHFRTGGHRAGEAAALNWAGWQHALIGEHERALSLCAEALSLQRALGDRRGEASTLDTIGYAQHHLGRHELALAWFEQALALHRELGGGYEEAEVLDHLAATHLAAGRPAAAGAAWQDALAILEPLGAPEAVTIRTTLATLRTGGRPAGAD